MVREILRLGDERLYGVSEPVAPEDMARVPIWVGDLHDTLMEYRRVHGAGRAIAAPQIGVFKRLIYVNIDRPCVLINPTLDFPDGESYELMDDCMSFPGLLVRVRRHRRTVLRYLDAELRCKRAELEGDLSELIQHEYDHLDGILATMRAVDSKSFFLGEISR